MLQKLELAGCCALTDVSLKVIAARLEGLTWADLSFCDVSEYFDWQFIVLLSI